MGEKIKKAVCFMIGMFMLTTTITYASSLSDKKNDTNKVKVEIIVNSNGEDFAEDIVFDDGTRLSDYDYSVTYVQTPKSYAIAQYFNYAAWVTRADGVTLSLDPKDAVRTNKTEKDSAWGVLSSPTQGFGSHSNWKNTQTMNWQFDCHYWFAESKDYWNIEPWRTAGSYVEVVANKCNP